jgi:hypothetical protein
VSCATGAHCEAGDCVDDCAGAVCPLGQACELGMCEGAPIIDPTETTGTVVSGSGGTFSLPDDATSGNSSTTSGGASTSGPGAPNGTARREGGDTACACRAAGVSSSDARMSWLLLGGLFPGLLRARVRRRKRSLRSRHA